MAASVEMKATLIVGIAVRAAGIEPCPVGERQPLKADVLDRPVDGSAHLDQCLEDGKLDVRASEPLSVPRNVVEPAGATVEVPLARTIEQLVRVLEPGQRLERPQVREHVDVRPAGLPHDDVATADRPYRAAHHLPLRPRHRLDAAQIAPAGHRVTGCPEPAGRSSESRWVDPTACSQRARSIDVELSSLQTPYHARLVDAARGVVQRPALHADRAADDRVRTGRGPPDHSCARPARIAPVEHQRTGQAVGPGEQVHGDLGAAVAAPRRADGIARFGERPERVALAPSRSVATPRGDPELNPVRAGRSGHRRARSRDRAQASRHGEHPREPA